jgi:outer membrane immunogenic protein
MRQLSLLTGACVTSCLLALNAAAGPEPLPSGKEMQQVAPAPVVECNWTGFYIGLNVGGEFGHAEDKDIDGYRLQGGLRAQNRPWGYGQSGVIAGGEVGYNHQWHWVVLGVEVDGGYMNVDGSGVLPESRILQDSDTRGHSESDFYTTFRGRAGVALDKWLFYATGGGIGVNWETRLEDNRGAPPASRQTIDAHKQEFDWGWTLGGGIERMLGCHWSIKAEYLYYTLDHRFFSGEADVSGRSIGTFRFRADDQGHIIRGGLNYKF